MIGASAGPSGTTFRVFTTTARRVAVRFFEETGKHASRTEPLSARADGWFEGRLDDIGPGALYKLVLDDDEVPDPAARFLPFGVHGPARVVATERVEPLAYPPPLHRWVIYELHVGTFTAEGTYRAAIDRLDDLVALGVTAIELMPLHAFPGERGWGYDSVALFAPYAAYGEPADLRTFVRAAHARGLAVVLDVVYNHFGPSGNYLERYAPSYFTDDTQTPWGRGPAFTEPHMRALVVDNARYWLEEFGFDALRIDATHAIHDPSPTHVLREIADVAHALATPRRIFLEDERGDPKLAAALGADGVWADAFHHYLHVLLTGERDGYYAKYEPSLALLARTIGNDPRSVTCIQNHDQVGNRADGSRLSAHVHPEDFRAAAALLLFLPTTPLLFMGQEWAASTPFLYFSNQQGDLGRAISEGRRKEFAGFASFAGEVPDPQARATFEASKLRWDERAREPHAGTLELHRAMLRLRQVDPVLSEPGELTAASNGADLLEVTRTNAAGTRRLVVRFGAPLSVDVPRGWETLLRTERAAVLAMRS